VLVSADSWLPYDRPSLSKKPGAKVATILLRGEDWYKEAGVEVWLNSTVRSIHHQDKAVELSTGKRIAYDQLLLATGGGPRRLAVPGEDLSGVVTLRTPADAAFVADHSVGKNVVIIGSSFIGMELAAAIVEKAESVTVVDRNKVPFFRSLGPEVGRIVASWHKAKGVKFIGEDSVREFIGEDGLELSEVLLESDTRLPASLAVIGVGVVPNTGMAKSVEGLDMDERGNIVVDEHMATSVPDIWAAGDIVLFPLVLYGGVMANLGHWGLACYLGRVAALNILGRAERAATVPFYWTAHYGKSVRVAGHRFQDDSLELEQEEGKFLAVYSRDGVVTAVATLGRDPVAAHFANLIRSGETLSKEDAFDYFSKICP
jgi:NADPH-dependent 2,4-dienoyl-CoA reductase/sulfur reductase-like enzyme